MLSGTLGCTQGKCCCSPHRTRSYPGGFSARSVHLDKQSKSHKLVYCEEMIPVLLQVLVQVVVGIIVQGLKLETALCINFFFFFHKIASFSSQESIKYNSKYCLWYGAWSILSSSDCIIHYFCPIILSLLLSHSIMFRIGRPSYHRSTHLRKQTVTNLEFYSIFHDSSTSGVTEMVCVSSFETTVMIHTWNMSSLNAPSQAIIARRWVFCQDRCVMQRSQSDWSFNKHLFSG